LRVIRTALVVEDSRFEDFLLPACRGIARTCEVHLEITTARTYGCNPRLLRELCSRSVQASDVVLVGADAAGERHRRAAASYRQKTRSLREILDGLMGRIVFAVAEPCVEAWLISEAGALASGLETGLGVAFRRPSSWPVPRGERQAKELLGTLISDGIGASLPRAGFEFAEEIVGRMDLYTSASRSLASWANETRGIFSELGGRGRAAQR
jgi:hypothetical protein